MLYKIFLYRMEIIIVNTNIQKILIFNKLTKKIIADKAFKTRKMYYTLKFVL